MSVENYVPVLPVENVENSGNSRLAQVYRSFRLEYGTEPEFYVKVPGRVNIIGEHVDYCGFPVLPMAIEQNILLAVCTSTDELLHLRNVNKKYGNFKCDLNNLRIQNSTCEGPQWYNYYLCGVKGILEHIGDVPSSGMMILVSGNVPPAAGLSSSSALVSAATLATAYICRLSLNKQSLASIAASCEQYIGTQGGGMDQAIAFLGQVGCAQFIEFYPQLQAESVRLPNEAHFVVANSLAEMNKAATSDFNERVVECRIACRLLAKKKKLNNWKDITKFAVLKTVLECDLTELERLAKETLTKDIYTRNDILQKLNVTKDELQTEFLTPNTQNMDAFKLRQRTLHVIQESIRVSKFREACEDANCTIEDLGKLMQESHNSLRYLYECSHPLLDELIDIAGKLGIHARLTGAGWGGCIVAICKSWEECTALIAELNAKYYKNLPQFKGRLLNDVVFATSPKSGAEIFLPNGAN